MIVASSERILVIKNQENFRHPGSREIYQMARDDLGNSRVESEFLPRGFSLDYCLWSELFKDHLEVVIVQDQEIVLHFVDGNFKRDFENR